jgi:hypothetical protein
MRLRRRRRRENGVLADQPPGQGALDFGAEGDFAEFLDLVARGDVALAVEARVEHFVELAGEGVEVGDAWVVGVVVGR